MAGVDHDFSPRQMKKDDKFYCDMQRYIAVTTVGPSALRNQGSKGVIKAAQDHLARIRLRQFRANNEDSFISTLDTETERLRKALPQGAKNWGAARKALNLFLRDICYNRFLCERHGLSKSEDWMEIPLDSLIAAFLKRKARQEKRRLPRWPGLTGLTREVSAIFQAYAKQVALSQGISRVHLDMRVWTEERERNVEQPTAAYC